MMPGWQSPKLLLLVWFLLTVALTVPLPAFAWGDECHKVIALIAEQYLDPAVRFQGRHTSRCRHCHFDRTRHRQRGDMGRQVSGQRSQRDQDPVPTWRWHFVDVELGQPDLVAACFGHPALPPGIPASKGPPQACVVDKINQFSAELGDPATAYSEQLVALKFLLHFVGDLHQPLHASDDHDSGGRRRGAEL